MLLVIIGNHGIKIINERDRSLFVKYFTTVLSGILAVHLISVFVTQAYAVDLAASLNPNSDISQASYVGVRTLTLQYPAGSSLAQESTRLGQRIADKMLSIKPTITIAIGEKLNVFVEQDLHLVPYKG